MNDNNRTDRILIAVALLVLLLAGGAFYFDGWMWGARRDRGERIGILVNRTGDVRLKFEDDLKWQKASGGQDLAYNDAVYAGGGSQAELMIGDSKMTVTENTLVVLRRDHSVNFLNLNYGTLLGNVAANEKIVIDTGDGKPIELTGSKDARIVVRRQKGKTQLDVLSGEAVVKIDGKMTTVNNASRFVVGDKVPADLTPNHIRILNPLKDQVIASDEPARIPFRWSWTNGRAALPDERFTLEFSGEPSFKNIHVTKEVRGALNTDMTVSQSVSLYYRVKGRDGEISASEKVNFVRLEKPLIVEPLPAARIELPNGGDKASVRFEFRRPQNGSVWYQVASDNAFGNIVLNRNTTDLRQVQPLPLGAYYVRARGDFGNGRVTGWTDVRPFEVVPAVQVFPLASRHLPTRVLIPNKAYPRTLYLAPSEMVQSFLATHGFLHDFFAYRSGDVDELKVQMESGDKEIFVQKDSAWPQKKLRPGSYAYRYQASKEGYQPSAWSKTRSLEIAMEPPKPLGEVTYGTPGPTGTRSAEWAFTPLLFAKTYDIQVAQNPEFVDALEFKSEKSVAQTELPDGEFYWRARARDRLGRIISPFSQPYKLKSMPQTVPMSLAKNDMSRIRRPAGTGSSSTKIVREREAAWERSGWWAWLGTGSNYVDYRQSLPTQGALQSHNFESGSQYFEGGYLGRSGIGGIISYKNTPGKVIVDNVTVNPNTYNWTTLSLEAMAKKESPFEFYGSPISYGMRVGVQQHRVPFLSVPADAGDTNTLDLKNSQMTTASMGLLAEMMRSRWTYYWSMRYQFPLSEKADGAQQFTLSPVFAFDGSLGTSYNLTQRLKLGMFWYGQWHQMKFHYQDGDLSNDGFQSLFYSNVDLRLGFDF